MFENPEFQKLVAKNNPTGEVVAVNRFLVTLEGLNSAPVGALILFENGDRGLVRQTSSNGVTVFNVDSESTAPGTLAVLKQETFVLNVGLGYVGRVVNAMGKPIDKKGAVKTTAEAPVFAAAPSVLERDMLNTRLTTGVTIVDALFPLVMGQRIAILGDFKTGKTTFTTQIALSQKGTPNIVVYVLIGKRKVEIDSLISRLTAYGVIDQCVIVVADVYDSLVQSYLAPYAACAIAEFFWQNGHDVVVVYDDLSNHAKVYRELALLSGSNPGRDSYPGDMFYTHSSLLERAGKLAVNGKTLTALPVVATPGNDITAYLPTNVMSITDGQIVFDTEVFRQGWRPAVHAGLSVSRVGGRAQDEQQKALSDNLFKRLADYRQALEFSHFGSELAVESRANLNLGQRLYEAFKQAPDEVYALSEQMALIEAVLGDEAAKTSVSAIKAKIHPPKKPPQPQPQIAATPQPLPPEAEDE